MREEESAIGSVLNGKSFKEPLVSQRGRATGQAHAEGNAARFFHRLALGLSGDDDRRGQSDIDEGNFIIIGGGLRIRAALDG